MGSKSRFQMTEVDYAEPHFSRTQLLLKSHPEVSQLVGHTPNTAWYVLLIVSVQIAAAVGMQFLPLWAIFLASYTLGAVSNHALWVLIHESTHNLIFKKTSHSCLLQIFCNLPIIFPAAISFRHYHMKHHLHQGELDRDADLPRLFEVNWVKDSAFRKAIWQTFYFVPQIFRVFFLKIRFFDRWVVLNWAVEFSFLSALVMVCGWNSFIYLALSSVFSIGLHPLGARILQEHKVVFEQQETYSYYGPLNRVAFNVGYHNEHHDLMGVPWSRLPQLRATAPELYDTLYYHKSWTGLLVRFIRDRQIGLFSRIIRTPKRRSVSV